MLSLLLLSHSTGDDFNPHDSGHGDRTYGTRVCHILKTALI